MDDIKEIVIDGNDFNSYENAYFVFKKAIVGTEQAENIGIKNLLKEFIVDRNIKATLIWYNSEKSKNDLGYESTKLYYKRRLQYEPFSEIINILKNMKDAENNIGLTLFDLIIKAFEENNIQTILK